MEMCHRGTLRRPFCPALHRIVLVGAAALGVACGERERAGDDRPAALTYPPLPPGVEEVGGMLLRGPDGAELGMTDVRSDTAQMLWLGRLTHRDDAGKAHWELLDRVKLSDLNAGESVAWIDCALDGVPDASIVAIGTWTPTDTLRAIREAWRPDLQRRRFAPLPVQRVSCSVEEDRR